MNANHKCSCQLCVPQFVRPVATAVVREPAKNMPPVVIATKPAVDYSLELFKKMIDRELVAMN